MTDPLAADDRPSLRSVAMLLRRSLAWMGPVRWHVAALLAGMSALALGLVPPGALLLDVVWTRVLLGQPLTELQAWVLRIDPAVAVNVATMAPEVRHAIAVRAVTVWVILAVPALFVAMGLWYYQIAILQWVNQRLRLAVFDRLQSLSLRFHGDARIGDAVYRLFQDSAMVTQVVQVLLLLPLFGIGRFVCSLAIVAAADPRLALVLAATWPPLALIAVVATPRLRGRFRVARARTSDLTASIEELLASLRVLKSYGAEPWALQRFTRDSAEAFRSAFAARRLLVGVEVLVFLVLGCALILATAWATLAAREGAPVLATRLLGLAGFTAWNLGCFQFVRNHLGQGSTSVRQLWRTWAQAQDVIVGLERAFALLDRVPDVTDAPDCVPFPFIRDGISVRGVTFGYEPERPVLRNVDLLARVDTMTAIMGPTGAGKSTLAALCLRLFDPDAGTITVDGINLRRIQVASLRDRIGLVLQEPLLFSASVRENIRYAAPHASDAAVQAAAHVACADGFIERLPAGYDTMIGERGARLSAGERQRLAIARAVLKDTPVVVLDEPTAALDPGTEALVLDRLAAWGRGRVIIVVTHRLATARRADQVVLFEEGRVIEAGPQDDLTDRPGGAYRALVASEHGGVQA